MALIFSLSLMGGCGQILGADPLVQRAVTLEVLRTQVAIAQEYAPNASPKLSASSDSVSSDPGADSALGDLPAENLPEDLPVAVDTLDAVSEALGMRVTHIRVKERLPLTVGDRRGFKISGTYDLDLDREGWKTSQRRSPFEIYLQRQPEGKTWRLAHLNPGDQDHGAFWELYRL
ncbi:MAG: hypothetical protein AAGA67_01425 [Cyanobacteria bacterium P01_F01_bin.153]